MKTSEQINEIAAALSKAQGEMKAAKAKSKNPHFKSDYADITAVWDCIKKPLSNNGLSILQEATSNEKDILIITRILHLSGQWIELGPLHIPFVKADAQGRGSAITYGKRYALCAAIGCVEGDDDDDGNAIVEQEKEQAKYVAKPAPYVAPEPKVEPKRDPKDCITPEQLAEFRKVWDQCSDDHRKTRTKILKHPPHLVNALAEIPKSIYQTELELAKLNAQLQNKEKDDV